MEIPRFFRKRDVESKLTETEKKVFHNFLRRMKELGIIDPDREKEAGSYKFVNEIYPIYILMESTRDQRAQSSDS